MPSASESALAAVATPCLVIDEALLDAAIARAARSAADAGLRFRPHAKTHKSVEIARRQLAAGAAGLTVATVAEAEVFAAAGFDDLFIGYPLWLDAGRAARLAAVLTRAHVTIGVDSTAAIDRIHGAALGPRLALLVEVDSGHHRSGVAPERAGEVAGYAAALGLDVPGVFTFPGHAYAPEMRSRAAADEAAALAVAAEALRAHGVAPRIVSGGSTPSVEFADASVVTEVRPGVSVFGDAQQWELGTIAPAAIALTVHATVVSRREGALIADAGSKALAMDRAAFSTGFGRLLDHPAARITTLSEHHATITGLDLPIGSRIRIVPNHVCNAVNLADAYTVVRDDDIATWPVDARGCTT